MVDAAAFWSTLRTGFHNIPDRDLYVDTHLVLVGDQASRRLVTEWATCGGVALGAALPTAFDAWVSAVAEALKRSESPWLHRPQSAALRTWLEGLSTRESVRSVNGRDDRPVEVGEEGGLVLEGEVWIEHFCDASEELCVARQKEAAANAAAYTAAAAIAAAVASVSETPASLSESPASAPVPPALSQGTELVDAFIASVLQQTGKNITRSDVALLAGYHRLDELQAFQRDKLSGGSKPFRKINAALNMDPTAAVASLPRLREAKERGRFR